MAMIVYLAAALVMLAAAAWGAGIDLPDSSLRIAEALAAGLVGVLILAFGRTLHLLQRINERLQPVEKIAGRLVDRTEAFDTGGRDRVERPAPPAPPHAASAPPPPPPPQVAEPAAGGVGVAVEAPEPVQFDVARPTVFIGPGDRRVVHRNRDAVYHADGTASLKTLAGWRRFPSIAEADDYLGR
jgi:hypothetical protein